MRHPPAPRLAAQALLLLAVLLLLVPCHASRPPPPRGLAWPWGPTHPSALQVLKLLTTRLYAHNDLDAIDDYCDPDVVVHGDGVLLPRTPFRGTRWARDVHAELFAQYTGWTFALLEAAAGSAAAKGFTDAFGFFHWSANNTGPYRGLPPTNAVSADYGVVHLVLSADGVVSDVTLWRAGFAEERGVLLRSPALHDYVTPLRDVTEQPFWMPSASVRARMLASAHALLDVLNRGEKFLDALDDLCAPRVVLADAGDVFGPGSVSGVPALKQWLGGWLEGYGQVAAAVTGVAATPYSNKVMLGFKLLLVERDGSDRGGGGDGGGGVEETTVDVEGVLLFVFNIAGVITHLVVWRNGTPAENREHFVGVGGGGGGGALPPFT